MVAGPQYFIASQVGFTSTTLDYYLGAGYYRMQHLIFTTQLIIDPENEIKYPVFWLRTNLKKIKKTKLSLSIKNKCSVFKISIKNENINEEVEQLYTCYKNGIPFHLSANCKECLHQPELPMPYDSKMIEVRKKDELIAVGFFDCGEKSIAGILNIYNPDYKKYSLGKFLMLQKIEYAIKEKMDFYYTGYFSTGLPKFDYKIFPDAAALEVYLPVENKWIPYESISRLELNKYAKKNFDI